MRKRLARRIQIGVDLKIMVPGQGAFQRARSWMQLELDLVVKENQIPQQDLLSAEVERPGTFFEPVEDINQHMWATLVIDEGEGSDDDS